MPDPPAPPAAAPARQDPMPPGRPAVMAPPKIRRPPRHPSRERTPFLHEHPVAAPGLKGHVGE